MDLNLVGSFAKPIQGMVTNPCTMLSRKDNDKNFAPPDSGSILSLLRLLSCAPKYSMGVFNMKRGHPALFPEGNSFCIRITEFESS
jgi:hypothetical protein